MAKKYEFTGETKQWDGHTLHRIRSCADIERYNVKVGDEGGWIESENNLDHDGNAWVHGNARVSGPIVCATRTDGYTFTCCQTKDGPPVIIAGCHYFTFSKARAHWTETRGGTVLGDESLALVDHLERMARIQGWLDGQSEQAA